MDEKKLPSWYFCPKTVSLKRFHRLSHLFENLFWLRNSLCSQNQKKKKIVLWTDIASWCSRKLKKDKTGLWRIEGHGSDSPISCERAAHIKPPSPLVAAGPGWILIFLVKPWKVKIWEIESESERELPTSSLPLKTRVDSHIFGESGSESDNLRSGKWKW